MDNLKTVEGSGGKRLDPLSSVQKEGVARMTTSLLQCTMDNPASVKLAIQNVTVLRIYHQVVRIVKYLDLMDKLEAKLYESIENTIEVSPSTSPTTWMMLLEVQEKLQKMMIDSHKMLQPYLDLEEFSITELMPAPTDDNPTQLALDSQKRDKLRTSAQAVLLELNVAG